jgi:hypothetical protein
MKMDQTIDSLGRTMWFSLSTPRPSGVKLPNPVNKSTHRSKSKLRAPSPTSAVVVKLETDSPNIPKTSLKLEFPDGPVATTGTSSQPAVRLMNQTCSKARRSKSPIAAKVPVIKSESGASIKPSRQNPTSQMMVSSGASVSRRSSRRSMAPTIHGQSTEVSNRDSNNYDEKSDADKNSNTKRKRKNTEARDDQDRPAKIKKFLLPFW